MQPEWTGSLKIKGDYAIGTISNGKSLRRFATKATGADFAEVVKSQLSEMTKKCPYSRVFS